MSDQTKVNDIRRKILEISFEIQVGHIGSALSSTEIIYTLFNHTMKLSPQDDKDFFVISKGHASLALYATMYLRGLINEEVLLSAAVHGSNTYNYQEKMNIPFVETSTGALGHGIGIAAGMAYSLKKQGKSRRVYCLVGDGEMQEGSCWETLIFAQSKALSNFTLIIDFNNLQGYGATDEHFSHQALANAINSLGFKVIICDGHNIDEVKSALQTEELTRPVCILAKTIKGRGVSFMENQLHWHYYLLTRELLTKALNELGAYES